MTATGASPGAAAETADRASSGIERAAARELGASFKRMMGAVRRLRGRETRRHDGLSEAQYGLLFGLRDHQQLSSGEVAALADLSPATATQMLEALESDGLVARERSAKDRRVVLTSLTERGHALLEARHARFAPRWNAATAKFSDAELRCAAAVLDELQALFHELADGEP